MDQRKIPVGKLKKNVNFDSSRTHESGLVTSMRKKQILFKKKNQINKCLQFLNLKIDGCFHIAHYQKFKITKV